jgi:tetratricopeptide (TPR) repeat protein
VGKASFLLIFSVLPQCASSDAELEAKLHGSIVYPFAESPSLGGKSPGSFSEPLIIRSITGGHEYVLEVPGGGEDYDIEIPLAEEGSKPGSRLPARMHANPVKTDQELVSRMPSASTLEPKASKLVDKAFGVGPVEGASQAPSYTMGLAEIRTLFEEKKYEYALVAVNTLLNSYPQSAQLYKMKGSLFIKIGNAPLAQEAWTQALKLAPSDRALRASLDNLQVQLESTEPKKKKGT